MFVGTHIDKRQDCLLVSERINGKRLTNQYPMIYEYFIKDENGYEMGIDNERLSAVICKNKNEFYDHKTKCAEQGLKTYELYFDLTHKVLYQNYKNCKEPTLHKAFIDIEVDYDPSVSGDIDELISKTPCAINAVTVYRDWLNSSVTLALKPSSLSVDEAKQITDSLPNTFLFTDEKDLIDGLICVLDDADVISGWNSEFFDIPYILHRTKMVFGEEKLVEYCLWNQQPILKEVEQYGKINKTYKLVGKWHIDYLLLYKKHSFSEQESYSLDNIAFEELGERKLEYEGSLSNLYYDNFKLFLEYNIQDTMLLHKIDKKKNLINIHNRQAHQLGVSLNATMGTVAWFDQAVINAAHDKKLRVPDRNEGKNYKWNNIRPPGAFVQDPVVGLHEWIADTDLNSLYPSTIRCLNMSPETIVGQIELNKTLPYLYDKIERNNLYSHKGDKKPDWGSAWAGDEMFGTLEYQDVINQTDDSLIIEMENGGRLAMTAKELYDLIYSPDSNLCISAFGTIFKTNQSGLVAGLLSLWYATRKEYQGNKKRYGKLADGIKISDELNNQLLNIETNNKPEKEYSLDDLQTLIDYNDISALKTYMKHFGLQAINNYIKPSFGYYKEMVAYWDLEQYIKKIQLNSAYGALLNEGSLFFDFRIGASTTISGRKIVQHMASKLNELSVGEYKHKDGIIIYGDTDSSYFSVATPEFKQHHPEFVYTKENISEYIDWLADETNKSYSEHMKKIFNVDDERADIIKAAREIIATTGLFVSKKRYALLIYDDEGKRLDTNGNHGKLKIKGLQIQRSDTPMIVRTLLKSMMNSLLIYKSKEKIVEIISDFYYDVWSKLNPWEMGSPRGVNKLSHYTQLLKVDKNTNLPGHVRASINWNRLCDLNRDTATPKIINGNKVVVCKVKPRNQLGINCVALPRDIDVIPEWFKTLPFDRDSMTESVINKTIDSIFGVLNWRISLNSINESKADIDDILIRDY